jgi:hypothetical protein
VLLIFIDTTPIMVNKTKIKMAATRTTPSSLVKVEAEFFNKLE